MDEIVEFPELPGYVSVKEAAKALGVSVRRVYKYAEAGKLRAFRAADVFMIPAKDLENFKQTTSGRPRKKTPAWHVAVGKSVWLHVFVQLRSGQADAFEKKLETMRVSDSSTFPGTTARYIARSDQRPDEVQILLIWRGGMIPEPEMRQTNLEGLQQELADVVDWQTARYETGQVLMHT